MKAIVQDGYGSPDVLELREVETPAVGNDRVLVRVRAASVNAADWHLLRRLPHVIAKLLGLPRTDVRGGDLAGHVEAVGKNVRRCKPGDEVFGTGTGTFAEYATTAEDRLAPKPRHLTFEQAAAVPVAGLTALQGLRDTARLQPGQRVLIYGAGGGVGTFAVQIAKALGAHVTAVSSTRNVDLVRSIGADEVVDYTKEDFTRRAERYHVLFDIGANRSFADCRRVLTPNGALVLAGAPSGFGAVASRLLKAQLISRIGSQRVASFMARTKHEDLVVLKELVEAGKLSPVIDRQFPLSEVPDALRYVGTREARGKVVIRVALVSALLCLAAGSALAQTRDAGPWWPHPVWGRNDQAGGSNWITPEKVLEAVRLVKTGRIYEIGQVYEKSMPLFGQRTYALLSPASPTYSFPSKNRLVGNDEFLCAEIGQVGTQFDGPGHIGMKVTMADGSVEDVYYNGFTGAEMYSPYGLQKLGVENVKPLFTRGILIDIAGYKGLPNLPARYEVTLSDVRGALARQGLAESDLRPGDALLFRYGWARFWNEAATYNTDPPGIGLEVAGWIVGRRASMVGSDQFGLEVQPNPDPSLAFPVHQELIMKHGIFSLENLTLEDLARDAAYEFLFVFTPVRFKGATGSPGRPIAIR